MELACLASKQAAASKQASSPAGPFLGPTATEGPKSKKKVTTLSGMVSRNFLGDNIFSVFGFFGFSVGNGDLVVFFRAFWRWALREIPGPGEKHENAISWC